MKILYLLMAALKFLGISILVLLLLLLFLLIIILTVPIKYNVYINKKEEIYAYTHIRWLYSVVGVDVEYDSNNNVKTVFKLFGITIRPKKTKTKEKKKPTQQKEPPKKQEKVKKSQDQKSLSKPKEITEKEINKQKVKKKKKTTKGKAKDIIQKIQSFTYKKELLADTIKWIRKFFKAVSPKDFLIDVELGREDPAETGWLMAILWMLYPCYYKVANIVGNYEKECLCGKISANGNLVLGRLVYDFLKYIRTKSVKELIVIIRKK